MPEISVIVPVYNAEEYLHCCVDSILSQTYADFELILVDDGSKDNSGKICDEYAEKDNRVKVLHKPNGGVSSARNAGVKLASGKYICFADSDDYLENDYLGWLLRAKNAYSDCDNVWCAFQTVSDYSGSDKKVVSASQTEDFSEFTVRQIMDLHEKWLDASPCNKLYSRQIIVNNQLKMDESLSLGEDLIFNFQYLGCANKKIVVINKPLYNYIQNGKESLDNKYYPDLFEIYKKIDKCMLDYAEKWRLDDDQIKKLYSASFYKYENVLRNTMKKQNTIGFLQKMRYNRSIMATEEFKRSLSKSDCYINKHYRRLYSKGNAFMIFMLDKLCRALKK